MTNTRSITISALAIGLVLASFTVFRHTTNLMNAIIVPLILAVLLFHLSTKQKILVYATTYFVVILLFPVQLVFMLLYIVLASRLSYLMHNQSVLIWIGHALLFAIVLFIATYLTEIIFLLHINRFIFNMLQRNVLLFVSFYLIESVLILLFQTVMMKQINKRMKLKKALSQMLG